MSESNRRSSGARRAEPGTWPVVALTLLCVALAGGVFRLLDLRLAGGDAYAPYSSQRADPRGARALHDALAELPRLRVERNFDPPERFLETDGWEDAHPPIVFVAGVDGGRDDRALALFVRNLATRGARVVVTIDPESDDSWSYAETMRRSEQTQQDGSPSSADGAAEERTETTDLLAAHGRGLALRRRPLSTTDDGEEPIATTAVRVAGGDELPATLAWRSPWVVPVLPPRWRSIYERDAETVIAERTLGRGEIVLLTDSFPLSNEGLARDLQPALLRWLLADRSHVIFDEYHLGTRTATGILALAARYRLHGFFVALAVVAGLFVWRTGQPFVPPAARQDPQATTTGRRTSQALVTLLRRGVPSRRLLAECLERWRRTAGRRAPESLAEELGRIADGTDHPAAGYEAMRRRLLESPHAHRAHSHRAKGVS